MLLGTLNAKSAPENVFQRIRITLKKDSLRWTAVLAVDLVPLKAFVSQKLVVQQKLLDGLCACTLSD